MHTYTYVIVHHNLYQKDIEIYYGNVNVWKHQFNCEEYNAIMQSRHYFHFSGVKYDLDFAWLSGNV